MICPKCKKKDDCFWYHTTSNGSHICKDKSNDNYIEVVINKQNIIKQINVFFLGKIDTSTSLVETIVFTFLFDKKELSVAYFDEYKNVATKSLNYFEPDLTNYDQLIEQLKIYLLLL